VGSEVVDLVRHEFSCEVVLMKCMSPGTHCHAQPSSVHSHATLT
jgi:hypothetical protein